jgi:glutaredoxin
LKAWADSLGGISYPLLSDFYPHGGVAREFGVLRHEGYAERAIFVIDRQGVIRYVDVHDIEEQPDNEELFRVLAALAPAGPGQPPPRQSAAPAPAPAEAPQAAEEVVLYCTSWCPDCRRARDYLRERQIAFREIDITRDREAARRVRGWANGNETTPTFDIHGTIVVRFDRARLDRLFER